MGPPPTRPSPTRREEAKKEKRKWAVSATNAILCWPSQAALMTRAGTTSSVAAGLEATDGTAQSKGEPVLTRKEGLVEEVYLFAAPRTLDKDGLFENKVFKTPCLKHGFILFLKKHVFYHWRVVY